MYVENQLCLSITIDLFFMFWINLEKIQKIMNYTTYLAGIYKKIWFSDNFCTSLISAELYTPILKVKSRRWDTDNGL